MGEGFLVAGIALFFICGRVIIVGGFVAHLFFYGRYADRKLSAVWAKAAQATGITRMDDAKYQLRAPPDTDLDTVLPESVRTELPVANPRVQIINDTVLWAHVRNVRMPTCLSGSSRPPPAWLLPLIKAKSNRK